MPAIDPKQTLEQEITAGLTELRGLLANCSTYSVAGWCLAYHMHTAHSNDSKGRLASPAKQIPFLLGVLLSRPEPTQSSDFGKAEWEQAKSILERLFSAYIRLYMPTRKQLGNLSPEWYQVQVQVQVQVREVSMPAFLHYFNTGLLASVQQIEERITTYLVPFDAKLTEAIGISASQALAICQWISDQLQKSLDDLQESAQVEHEKRLKLLEQAQEEWSLDALKDTVQDPDFCR